jgi:hypothetical protein
MGLSGPSGLAPKWALRNIGRISLEFGGNLEDMGYIMIHHLSKTVHNISDDIQSMNLYVLVLIDLNFT